MQVKDIPGASAVVWFIATPFIIIEMAVRVVLALMLLPIRCVIQMVERWNYVRKHPFSPEAFAETSRKFNRR